MKHIADDQDALLDYLYEEGDAAERLTIARHLQDCATCSVAVLELQSVRGMLNEWAPPAAQLGFKVVQEQPRRVVPAWLATPLRSGWAQAAAAVLLFAAGVGVSQLDVEYGPGTLTVRTRWAAPASESAVRRSPPVVAPLAVADVPVSALSVAAVREQPRQSAAATDDEELLKRVRALIDESELRQRRELALRLSQVASEVDTQHQADLLRIQQNFGQLETSTGAEIAQQRQLVDYLVRTSGGAK